MTDAFKAVPIIFSCCQGVQAGGESGGSTVISWVVDDDNSVVKYCQDNIVTIFVPGDNDEDDANDAEATIAIVANNTLRLRIVPYEQDQLGVSCYNII